MYGSPDVAYEDYCYLVFDAVHSGRKLQSSVEACYLHP
jgi:hypothetical protein